MRRVGSLLIGTLLVLASSASAQTEPITLGPNLGQYSDTNEAGCSGDPFGGAPLSAPSCTWSSAAEATPLGGQMVPGSGTISAISVKVGAVTGPMKVVVMRDEFQLGASGPGEGPPPSICCTATAESQEFTPTANSITTLPVALPVEVKVDRQTLTIAFDLLGLSVLEDGVPVPAAANVHETEAAEEGEAPRETQPETFVEQPAMQVNGQVQTAKQGKGLLVLMDAVFNPVADEGTSGSFTTTGSGIESTSTSTSQQGPGATGGALIRPGKPSRVRVKGDYALLTLRCGASAPCRGSVRLQSAQRGQASSSRPASAKPERQRSNKRKARLVTFAQGTFTIGAGRQRTVKAKLSSAGRRLARKHRRLGVWINITLAGHKPPVISSRKASVRF